MISNLFDDSVPYQCSNFSNGSSSGDEEDVERLLSNAAMQSFITDSPFSFRNPIFFSVPRDVMAKKVEPKVSKRYLFEEEDKPKESAKT